MALTPERWQAVKELLDRALQHAPLERAAFLENACGGDEALRSEVESLLAVEDDGASFLEPRAATPPDDDEDLSAQLQVALGVGYRLERELGRGGMSTVYLAHDHKHRRQVAVKLLREGARTARGARRFQREIDVLAQLQHPNILPLYDSGALNGAFYYVMPFVEGETLRARLLREERLPIDDAVRIACEVADALGYAHARGIVHRDIKPENILLSGEHAMVADFGIGKFLEDPADASLTASGDIVGTPAYVSPEQGAGEIEIDGRSDIYSLGIVLYELLVGEPPFGGRTPQAVIVARFTEPVPSLRARRTSIPESLERAVLRCLTRGRDDRFQTAGELIAALELSVSDEHRSTVHPTAQLTAPSAATAAPSIVILPFVNMSGNSADDFLSDGITEEIINVLTQLRTIRVVARTSAFAFKGKSQDVRVIARRLNVSRVLEGSVRRWGRRLRVAAELIDATDGCRIWGEQFDREADNVLGIQDELARRIVDTLAVTFLGTTRGALSGAYTKSAKAYESYLKGRHCWHRRTERDLLEGIPHFEKAIELDPSFALAFAGLADTYAVLCIYGLMSPEIGMPRARAAALTALDLMPSLAEAFTTLGCIKSVYDWTWASAERDFQRALMLNPQHPSAHHRYAIDCLTPQGRFAEASAELDQARALDPLSLIVNTSLGLPSYFARRFDEA
ncbi:MAG: protein kinase domain-containing protein, partial [Gemmatimonas sp.]